MHLVFIDIVTIKYSLNEAITIYFVDISSYINMKYSSAPMLFIVRIFISLQQRRVSTSDALRKPSISPFNIRGQRRKTYVDPLEMLIPTEEEDSIRLTLRVHNSNLHIYFGGFFVGCTIGVILACLLKSTFVLIVYCFGQIMLLITMFLNFLYSS